MIRASSTERNTSLEYNMDNDRGKFSYIVRRTITPSRATDRLIRISLEKVIDARSDVAPPRVSLICIDVRGPSSSLLLLLLPCSGTGIVRRPLIHPCCGAESIAYTLEPTIWVLLKPSQLVLYLSGCSERRQGVNTLSLSLGDDGAEERAEIDSVRGLAVGGAAKHVGKGAVACT